MFQSKNKWSKLGVITILMGTMLFVSCKENLNHKDRVAAIIGKLDSPFLMGTFVPENLIDKAGLKEGALPFVQQTVASFFMKEEKTGINNKEQVQFVMAKGEGSFPQAYVFIPLKNAEKFKKLVQTELSAEVQEKDGAYYFRKDADNYLVVWKEDLAIVSNIPISLENILSSGGISSKKAALSIVNLMNQAATSDIAPTYRSFMDKTGDIQMYMHGQNAYNMVKEIRFFPSKYKRQLKTLLLGSTVESEMNFENGAITLKSNHLLSDSLNAYLEVLKDGGISNDILAFGFTDNPIMAFSMNMNPTKILKLMDETDMQDYTVNMSEKLKNNGISKEDIAAFSTGEVLFILDGYKKIEQSENLKNMQDLKVNFAMVYGVKDTAVARMVMQKMLADSSMTDKDEIFMTIKNNYLISSNSKTWIEKINNNEGVSLKNLKTELTVHPIGMYINSVLLGKFPQEKELDKAMRNVSKVIFDFNKNSSNLTIKMKDENKNALRIIVEKVVEEMLKAELNSNSDVQAIIEQEMLEGINEEAIENVINAVLK